MAGPRLLVAPPTFTPSQYGLLSVAQTPPQADAHWQNGVRYQTRCVNDGGTTYDECIAVTGVGGSPPPPSLKAGTADLTMRVATPVTVYAKFDCAPVGIEDARGIATAALSQNGTWQLERAFWTGQADGQSVVYPHLAATAEVALEDGLAQSIPATGTASDVVCALGFLEQELADCYNGVGVIHVPVKALPALVAWNLVEARGPQLRTKNGNLVAVGSGYPGTGPGGEDPGQCGAWLYATGAVFAYAGAVKIPDTTESINRAENTVEMIAERTYVAGWDCCHAAVEADITVPTAP